MPRAATSPRTSYAARTPSADADDRSVDLPVDLFDAPMTEEIQRIAADRALIARYCLDRLDATA